MTSISKNVYIDKLDDTVNEYNNTYHATIKMKPIDVKDNTYINADKEINNKDPKFKVGDRVRISKYKNIFAKGYIPNWSEEVFVIKKVKNTVPWTYVINDLNGEEITGTFYEKELQKANQEEFRIFLFFFITAIWLPHGQRRAIIVCIFDPKVTGSLVARLGP